MKFCSEIAAQKLNTLRANGGVSAAAAAAVLEEATRSWKGDIRCALLEGMDGNILSTLPRGPLAAFCQALEAASYRPLTEDEEAEQRAAEELRVAKLAAQQAAERAAAEARDSAVEALRSVTSAEAARALVEIVGGSVAYNSSLDQNTPVAGSLNVSLPDGEHETGARYGPSTAKYRRWMEWVPARVVTAADVAAAHAAVAVPVEYINLTPHAIVLNDGREFPASGIVARVSQTFATTSDPDIVSAEWGHVQGLPASKQNVRYIVSALVLSALEGSRPDCVAPATGHPDAIRNERGQVVSVPAFIQ